MSLQIQERIALAAHTTLHVGGVADYFCVVRSAAELTQALQFAAKQSVPVFVLGGGSNVLFPDEGYRGLVIHNAIVGQQVAVQANDVLVQVGAGEQWDAFVAQMCEQGYWGIENLSAIPGSVGATPIQNVGAYGVEVADVIQVVTAMRVDTQEIKTFAHAQCAFEYRDSYFKSTEGRQWVVLSVTFKLSNTAKPVLQYADLYPLSTHANLTVAAVRDFVIAVRSKKFPDWSQVGTAGSFFKNPIVPAGEYQRLHNLYPDMPAHQNATGEWKLSLGWILDRVCGLKGYCEHEVCLYENQALVLTNTGTSAENITNFVASITKTVFDKTQVQIEPEVLLVKNENT
jgi:UDP-N-acetylmuramate dehydrogenase